MPPEQLYALLTEPLGIAAQLALPLAGTALLRRLAPQSFARLGWRAIARGYAGVAAASLLLALMEAWSQGRARVARGLLPAGELAGSLAPAAVYLFVLILFFASLLLAGVLVPASVWLAGRRRASVMAVGALGVAVAVTGAAATALMPAAETERLAAALAFFTPLGFGAIVMALVYALACPLPWRAAAGR